MPHHGAALARFSRRCARRPGLLLVAVLASSAVPERALAAAHPEVLRAELVHWESLARDTSSGDEFQKSVYQQSLAPLEVSLGDLRAGRTWSALHRFAPVRINLSAARYASGFGAAEDDASVFEREYSRIGAELRADSAAASPATFAALSPMVVRAEAEATAPQGLMFHHASLEYGRNTMMRYGLFYLGSALAQREFTALCHSVAGPAEMPAPPLRSIRPEIDALQSRLLAAYRPPASVARHAEFIAASSVLKEARSLEASGFRAGALLRYLQAVTRSASLLGLTHSPPPDSLSRVLDEWAARMNRERVDHSLGEMLLQLARGDLAGAPGTSPASTVAIAMETMPRYFEALTPSSARPEKPRAVPAEASNGAASVTVTLVRWPFT